MRCPSELAIHVSNLALNSSIRLVSNSMICANFIGSLQSLDPHRMPVAVCSRTRRAADRCVIRSRTRSAHEEGFGLADEFGDYVARRLAGTYRSDGLARVQRTRFYRTLVVCCGPVRFPRLRGTKRVASVETRLQDSMWRIRPAITEGSRDDRVLRLRRHERIHVCRM